MRPPRRPHDEDDWYRTPEDKVQDCRMVNALREMIGIKPLYGVQSTNLKVR